MNAKQYGTILLAAGIVGAGSSATAADACSLLTSAEVESTMKGKITQTLPSSVASETGCVFKLGQDQVILSYFTDPATSPKVASMKDDPFMRGPAGPNLKDYGNIGCKVGTIANISTTNCNRYQPRWLHLSVQTRGKDAISMDAAKALLEKAGTRFK